MRSTTHAQPKLFSDKKDKLSESMGFKEEIKLPMPEIIGSIRSESTENKSMPIPMQKSSMQKNPLKRADTMGVLPSKPQKSLTSIKEKPRVKQSPEQSPQNSQNERAERRQPQQQIQPMHFQIKQPSSPQYNQPTQHSNFNVNVNVAVNLGDLSKKVDEAYGRVRAISQSNEIVLKSVGMRVQ